MRITMQHAQRLTLGEMREFVASSGRLSFTGAERKQIYGLVERTLRMSDTECARHMQQRKRKLLASCRSRW